MNDISKKQQLAQMLIEANELKNQYIEENQPKRKIAEATNVCTQMIISLIEEGVPYKYDKKENRQDDLINIEIEDEIFSCCNNEIKEYLSENYDTIMGLSYEKLTGEEYISLKKDRNSVMTSGVVMEPSMQPFIVQIPEAQKPAKDLNEELQKLIPPKVYLREEELEKSTVKTKPRWVMPLIKAAIIFAILGVFITLCFKNPTLNMLCRYVWKKTQTTVDSISSELKETEEIETTITTE